MIEIEMESILKANKDAVMSHALTLEGVNEELSPFARMTIPRPWKGRALDTWPTFEKVFDSYILLFCVLPVDIHHLCIESIDDGGFKERSSTLMHRYWNHDRTIADLGNGTVSVRDRVCFKPKMPLAGLLIKPLYNIIFKNRHKKLKQKFNCGPRHLDCIGLH